MQKPGIVTGRYRRSSTSSNHKSGPEHTSLDPRHTTDRTRRSCRRSCKRGPAKIPQGWSCRLEGPEPLRCRHGQRLQQEEQAQWHVQWKRGGQSQGFRGFARCSSASFVTPFSEDARCAGPTTPSLSCTPSAPAATADGIEVADQRQDAEDTADSRQDIEDLCAHRTGDLRPKVAILLSRRRSSRPVRQRSAPIPIPATVRPGPGAFRPGSGAFLPEPWTVRPPGRASRGLGRTLRPSGRTVRRSGRASCPPGRTFCG